MSRSQQGQTFNTASGENKIYNTEAQTSFDTTNKDIGNYASEVGKFNAANPYVQGGQAQTVENQELADTAAGGAQAAGQALQGSAVRTGQNAGGAIAATENMDIQNGRALAGEEAGATERRLAAGTGYAETGLNAAEKIPGMQDTVAEQQAQAAQGALGTQEQAAQTPSFMDELGNGIIQAGVGFASGDGAGYGKALGCWIAAAIFGEDFATGPKTLLVRNWLWTQWIWQHWYAKPILCLYSRYGERLSKKPWIIKLMRPLFEMALKQAVKHGN